MVIFCTRLLPACLLALVLAGCHFPPREDAVSLLSWEELQSRLSALPSWQLRARLHVQAPGGRQTVWVYWRQEGERYELRLSDLLGRTALLLEGGDGPALLKRPGHDTVQAASAEEALQQVLGWAVPVSQLRYWLLGIPAPGLQTAAQRVESGVLVELQQLGWHLQFSDYRKVDELRLPDFLRAEREGLQVSLSISHWYFPKS